MTGARVRSKAEKLRFAGRCLLCEATHDFPGLIIVQVCVSLSPPDPQTQRHGLGGPTISQLKGRFRPGENATNSQVRRVTRRSYIRCVSEVLQERFVYKYRGE